MRVDEPMLSMVATRRRADRRSGASVQGTPSAFEFVDPRNEAQDLRGDLDDVDPQHEPILHPFTPNYESHPFQRAFAPDLSD